MIEAPYCPIIYLRGYAGTQREVEDTVATPFMGFNLGSTKVRQRYTGEVQPHVFESPVIRLMEDHKYVDAYRDGQLLPKGPIPSRSIWIFRYYDITSEEIGEGERKEIEFHAKKLREFILHVREAVLKPNEDPERFRVYLVAHSMGGLVCRCYLQNSEIPDLDGNFSNDWRKKGVDKLFTYATPHGGIDFQRGGGLLEGFRDFFDPNNAANFGPKRMREFLDLQNTNQPLNSLNGRFPEDRVFCLVGTDSRDYGAWFGLARRAVGPMSDGLVLIKNASVLDAPRAFVHRSHSGHYGIVNSESGYQNLRRFLFGDTRVTVEMVDVQVSLPPQVKKEKNRGKEIRASYHIDVVFTVRGLPIELHRRTYDEESAIFRTYEKLTKRPTKLLTAFLLRSARVKPRRPSLGFSLRIHIRVPEYEVEGLLFKDHYEGGILFSDKLNIEVNSKINGTIGKVEFGWDSSTPNLSEEKLMPDLDGETLVWTLPFSRKTHPGITGKLRLTFSHWNITESIS